MNVGVPFSRTFGTRRLFSPALAAFGLVVVASGCAHEVAFYSEPPGAEVYIEDELVCRTPCVWEERSTHADEVRVEVRGEEEAVRFDLLRDGFMFEPIILGVVAGGLAFAAAGGATAMAVGAYTVTSVLLVTGVGILPGTPLALFVLGAGAVVAYLSYAFAVGLASLAPRLPLAMAGEASRIADNEVYVDFETNEVYGDAGDDIRRLVGVHPGRQEMPLPVDDDERELSDEREMSDEPARSDEPAGSGARERGRERRRGKPGGEREPPAEPALIE